MADDRNAPHFTWHCPGCGRHVPQGVNECRCGVRSYEAVQMQQQIEASQGSSNAAPRSNAAAALEGHAATGSSAGPRGTRWAVMLAACLIAAVGLAFGVSALMRTPHNQAPRETDIHVLSRLDEHTTNAGSRMRNTIPSFLALPGKLGVLESEVAPSPTRPGDPVTTSSIVKEIKEVELQKGICSPNLPLLVRQQFPGSYDDWPDDKLERTVLKTHPEYRGKLCVLPAWIDVNPHDIVKYELVRR